MHFLHVYDCCYTLQQNENAVWAIAEVLGLVDRGCPMAWGGACACDPILCRCVNCKEHQALREVSNRLCSYAYYIQHDTSFSMLKQLQSCVSCACIAQARVDASTVLCISAHIFACLEDRAR